VQLWDRWSGEKERRMVFNVIPDFVPKKKQFEQQCRASSRAKPYRFGRRIERGNSAILTIAIGCISFFRIAG